ncbi:hypothetical protein AOLI_G00277150 [Acnodon oligacanthus]
MSQDHSIELISSSDILPFVVSEPVERLRAAFNMVELTVLCTIFNNSLGSLDQDQAELVTEEDRWLVAVLVAVPPALWITGWGYTVLGASLEIDSEDE